MASSIEGFEKQLAPGCAIRIQGDTRVRPARGLDRSSFFRRILSDINVEIRGLDYGWM